MSSCSLRLTAIAIIFASVSSCGGDSPTSPSGSGSSTSSSQTLKVVLHFNVVLGSFTASLQGRSMDGAGPYRFDLPPGQYEMTGQLRGGPAGIVFSALFTKSEVLGVLTSETGGVAFNSVRSLAGPGGQATSCGVLYSLNGSGTREFRVQFSVTNSGTVGSYCP